LGECYVSTRMPWHPTSSVALVASVIGAIATARSVAAQPATRALVAPPSATATAPATTAVAAFPDLPPERPTPPVDPALALLDADPYEAELTAIKIARNLYGGDPLFDNPYSDAVRLANPYTDASRLAPPAAAHAFVTDGYGNALLDEDPYR